MWVKMNKKGFFDLEVSMIGILGAVVGGGTILITKKWMLDSFTQHMSGFNAIFWTIATIVSTSIAGYFIFVKIFEDG